MMKEREGEDERERERGERDIIIYVCSASLFCTPLGFA